MKWTESDIKILKRNYPRYGAKWCAKKLNRTEHAVHTKAYYMGIKMGLLWTEKEEKRLIDLSENYTMSDIAKKIGRSTSAITNKRNRMELGNFLTNTEFLTLNQVSELVGRDKGTITKIWCRDGLQSQKRGCYRVFHETDLIKFMKNHPTYWNARKCDYYTFQQYDWFMKKYESDKIDDDVREWTISDIQRLEIMRKRGFTIAKIAVELGRTERAVRHKLDIYKFKKG